MGGNNAGRDGSNDLEAGFEGAFRKTAVKGLVCDAIERNDLETLSVNIQEVREIAIGESGIAEALEDTVGAFLAAENRKTCVVKNKWVAAVNENQIEEEANIGKGRQPYLQAY